MQFEKGHPKMGGRARGTRNRLSNAFINALAKEFDEHGEGAIRIARVEQPLEFLKLVSSLIPKEFEITDSRLKEIPDDELDALIELARRRIAAGIPRDVGGREDQALN